MIAGRISEDLEHTLGGADGLLIPAEGRSERADRGGDRERIQQEHHQRSGRELAFQHLNAALPQDDDQAGKRREREHAEEQAAHARPLQRRLYARLYAVAVPRPLDGLLHEALHRPDLAEGLFGGGRGFRDAILHAGGDPA